MVAIRNWHVFDKLRKIVIQMEYCPYGDLAHLLSTVSKEEGGEFPEEFVWWALECMATAELLMEHGNVRLDGADSNDGTGNWNPILHL